MNLFMKTITAIDQAVSDSVIFAKEDIQHIIFSGGSANIHSDQGVACCLGPYLSVGIETAGGMMVQYADYMSAHEFDKVLTFSTAIDNQERVVIRDYEGERATASQNVYLGDIELSGIPPAPKG
ncbi:ATPase with role in protein import into the ER, partial [Podila verticillata]